MSASADSLGNSCDNPNGSGGDKPPYRQDTSDTHNSTEPQDNNNTTTNEVAPGNSRTSRTNLRDEANGDDNSGFATSDFPPLPTHSNYPLFAEVRRLKEALQTENRKVAALEEELGTIKRWLGQAPAEIVALLPSEATKSQAVSADGATSDAGGSADIGGRAGSASHERFRQRTGNPRSSFFTNSRVDLNYNYRTNPGQNTGGNGRNGSDVAAARLRNVGAGGAQGRLDLPGEGHDRSGGQHGSGLVATIDYSVSSRRDGRGSRRGRGARRRGSSEAVRSYYVHNAADYGNPFPGPNTAAGGGWDDAGSQSNLGDW